MDETEIDVAAYKLVDALDIKEILKNHQNPGHFDNISGIPKIMELEEVKDLETSQSDFFGENIVSRFSTIEKREVGLDREKYKAVKEIALIFLQNKERSQFADHDFIEKEIFDWIINIYKVKSAPLNLVAFLEKRIDEEVKDYTYHFKIYPLGIELPFNIGPVQISAFTNTYLQNAYDSLPLKNKPDWQVYQDMFKYFDNSITATVTVRAVLSKAEKIAKSQVSLSISALKCLFIAESMSVNHQIFDVDFKISNTSFSSFICEDDYDKRLKINLKKVNGTIPIIIREVDLTKLNKLGLEKFNYFLNKNNDTELYIHLLTAIEHYGEIISTRNLYDRIVAIISFFELLIVPETSIQSKSESYLKNNVLHLFMNSIDAESLKIRIRKIYNIRNKYLHNRVELPIDIDDLFHVQLFGYHLLLNIIDLNERLNTKEDIYNHFSIPL